MNSIINSFKQNPTFQIIDWFSNDKPCEELHDFNNIELEGNRLDIQLCKFWNKLIKSKRVENNQNEFIVYTFGRTQEGNSVSTEIKGFYPMFYINIPSKWDKYDIEEFKTWFLREVWVKFYYLPSYLKDNNYQSIGDSSNKKCYKRWTLFYNWINKNDLINDFLLLLGIVKIKFHKKQKLKGFTNNKLFHFLEIRVTNMRSFYCCKNLFEDKIQTSYDRKESIPKRIYDEEYDIVNNKVFELYESNIHPMIRFIHYRDILPCGWVKVDSDKMIIKRDLKNINIKLSFNDISPFNRNDNAPIPIAFYDIECDSSHGDFPQAKKTYKSVVREISAEYTRLYTKVQLKNTNDIDRKYFYKKLDSKVHFIKEILFNIYENGLPKHNISNVFWKKNKKKKKMNKYNDCSKKEQQDMEVINDYAETIKNKKDSLPIKDYINLLDDAYKLITPKKSLRFNSLSRFNLEYPKIRYFKKNKKELIEYVATLIYPLLSENYNKLGLSKLEINKVRNINLEKAQKIMDKYLVPLEGDPVIQIGTCFLRYGEKTTYLNHILTLGTCDPIEGVEVVQCKTEEELILKWQELLLRENPDIISGYNIYSFDFPYIWDRAVELGKLEKFRQLSKFKGYKSNIKEKTLTSAALGHTTWREIETIGRIQVDLFKVIQRDYNLASYKLDNVSAHFMKGKVSSVIEDNTISKIKTDNTKGIQKDSYIKFTYTEGHSVEKHKDGKKYHVIDINENIVTLEDKLEFLVGKKYDWCMAKDDVSPKDIFSFQKQGSDKRCIIAKYCVKDVILCVELLLKLEIMSNNIGMANVCHTPLHWIFTRGQGIKIFSLVSKQCREDNFLIPVLYKDHNSTGFEGAIVLKPTPGIYLDAPVSVMDYASLYPSSMISENLSHDSIVTNKKWLGEEGGKKLNKMGFEYEDITYDQFKKVKDKKVKIGEKTCRFIQPKKEQDGSVLVKNRGVMPRILMKLLGARKSTRKKIPYKIVTLKHGDTIEGLVKKGDNSITIIKENGEKVILENGTYNTIKDKYNQFEKAILDGLQLAYKMTANSLYGQIGASTSQIRWIDIAASTTATGRDLLNRAGNFVRSNYRDMQYNDNIYIKETKIVYGDSVTGDTPILLKNENGNIEIKTIETLSQKWEQYNEFKPFDSNRKEKQQSKCNYKVWSRNGWTNIKRVIRHKTKKRIFRVLTHTGVVDVSEDHSLLNSKNEIIKPNKCKIGETELLQHFPTKFYKSKIIEDDNINLKILNSSLLKRKEWFYSKVNKDFDFSKNKLFIKNKLTAQVYYTLIKSIGFLDIGINFNNKTNNYEIYKLENNINPKLVKKIIDLRIADENEYIYDIETEDGSFQAGIGNIIVKNTDSIFVRFVMNDKNGKIIKNKEALKASIDISCHAEKQFQKLLKYPHNLEYEKTFWPFILFSKKRYVGNKYEFKTNYYKQTSMGIVLKRRDNAPIVKYTYGGIIDIIMNQLNINKSIDFLTATIRDIIHGDFPIDKFIITKSLRANYKDPQRIAHKVLADRIGERDPGNKPKPNDRIPYVYIKKEATMIVKETMLKLRNEKFGRYLIIYNKKIKNKQNITITITDKEEFNLLETKHKINEDIIRLAVELEWDWDNKKNKGYSIEKTSNRSILDNLCKNRLTKPPVLSIKNDKIIILHKKDIYKLEPITINGIIQTYINNCEKKEYPYIITFHKYLFHENQIKLKKSTLQGDRIEHPTFIREKNLEIDYQLYITNQLMKPICQIYGLIVERLDKKYKFPYSKDYYKKEYNKLIKEKEETKVVAKIRDMREKMAKELLFMPTIKQFEKNKAMKNMWNKFGFFTI